MGGWLCLAAALHCIACLRQHLCQVSGEAAVFLVSMEISVLITVTLAPQELALGGRTRSQGGASGAGFGVEAHRPAAPPSRQHLPPESQTLWLLQGEGAAAAHKSWAHCKCSITLVSNGYACHWAHC